MRELVTIRTISDIQPIEGADRIEVASIDGWRVVVSKGEFKIGDKCIYFEIDSFIPSRRFEELPFLEKTAIRWRGKLGTRIRTMKLRKQISQGLAVPITTFKCLLGIDQFSNKCFWGFPSSFNGSMDEFLGVEHWEPTLSVEGTNFRMQKGNFPSFIPKTDQERIQNIWHEVSINMWDYKADDIYEVTQKLDGTSCTMFFNEGSFGVCTRNFEIRDDVEIITDDSTGHEKRKSALWILAKKYKLEEQLRDRWEFLSFQGEVVGPGINKNRDGLPDVDFYVFDIYDIENKKYLSSNERIDICHELGLSHVPIIEWRKFDFVKIEDALKYAEGKSAMSDREREREGVVFKNVRNPALSFKIINNNYLLKHGE